MLNNTKAIEIRQLEYFWLYCQAFFFMHEQASFTFLKARSRRQIKELYSWQWVPLLILLKR